ncbi:sugar phosphate isomerase [Planosporangium flavigriseum]|uniref:Sugar phosphate isomerase n=1 Tax=Planosporangium flavigriseum TaxID=373681 RepID=A0A8J3LI84_9ACTN|nr:EboA domain-containing protein [Planosporangium flavigriseum]NJC66549.1 sugar phosphate isomerase [Planosporangium flavigriseum]GIG73422.1 hypothetical protein Pfl04_18260 [Planosporangium flavigriseum]
MTGVDELRGVFVAVAEDGWLSTALARVAADPAAINHLFPAVGRHCGRAPLAALPTWSTDDAARALLLLALPPGDGLPDRVELLYRYGDAAEKRAVLRALPLLVLGAAAVPLLQDAIRTNDPRLLAAALGPYAAHLDDATWRQAVLKCVFMGLPLSCVADLYQRADAELATMLAGLVAEREAAGRAVAEDVHALLHHLTAATEG